MEKFWAWAAGLPGQTLCTVTGQPFSVITVSRPVGISVTPESSGIPRTIPAQDFESALALGLRGRALSPRRISEAGASEYNPSYVAVLLQHFYDVQDDERQGGLSRPTSAPVSDPSMPSIADLRGQKITLLVGTLRSQPKVGLPDGRGRPTAWARFACDGEGRDGARMYSCTFHGETMSKALALAVNTRVIVECYVRPSDDPDRWDSISVFGLYT
jgi:hypothetical protein